MKPATACERVTPQFLHWTAYCPAVKTDLASAAYRSAGGWVLIDPIELAPAAWEEAFGDERPVAVFLTNGNHERAAALYQKTYGIPIHAPAKAADLVLVPDARFGEAPVHGLRPVAIPGATEEETAFLAPEGILFLGDAIINLESHGLALLPKKYTWNDKAARASLKKLLDYEFSIVSFAHGTPLRTRAHERLRALLD